VRALAPGLKQDAQEDWDGLEEELERLANGLAPELLGIAKSLDQFSKLEMAKALGVDLRADPRLLYTSQKFVRENVALIKAMGREQIGKLRPLVEHAVTQQLSYQALSEQLQERMGVVGSRADLIARDQILKHNSQLSQMRAEAVGVRRYRWSSSRDERVRPDHARLNGQVFEYANPPVVDQRTGRRGNPGSGDYQCRCLAIPETDDLLLGSD
jgi:SPP1 gp7 family putative phage head morphogenesis protein